MRIDQSLTDWNDFDKGKKKKKKFNLKIGILSKKKKFYRNFGFIFIFGAKSKFRRK